jgi:hypothetical protein
VSLDLSRLENVRQRGSKTTARCPACAESGGDNKGEHLMIMPDGRFGCVAHPGTAGKEHRQRVFSHAGNRAARERKAGAIRVRRPPEVKMPGPAPTFQGIGRFGRVSETYARGKRTERDELEGGTVAPGGIARNPSKPSKRMLPDPGLSLPLFHYLLTAECLPPIPGVAEDPDDSDPPAGGCSDPESGPPPP